MELNRKNTQPSQEIMHTFAQLTAHVRKKSLLHAPLQGFFQGYERGTKCTDNSANTR